MEDRIFTNLTINLEATLHESMVKVGYIKGQAVSIYYLRELLFHLLELNLDQEEEAHQRLINYGEFMKKDWGLIIFSEENGRYKITVSAEGMEYIHEKFKDNHFLDELIDTLRKKDITIDTILNVFYRYSNEVSCIKSNHEDFEYSIQFKDKTIDPFIYCFTFDEMGQYYHRFTEFDFQKL